MANPLPPPSSATHTTAPHNNDVLCGRGGTINAHPGNEQYRKFVERKKRVYLTARFKREKRLIASSIVDEIRNLDPPGRFLTKDPHSDAWYDVGDEKARDKTSQALRENALSVRKQMEEEFQETRRQQAREVAIAAGRDPDEAVKNMMSAVASLGKAGKDRKKGTGAAGAELTIPPGPPAAAPGGFVGRSGYGPLYDAQQPAPPRPTAGWGYGPHGGPPPPHHPHPGGPGYGAAHPPPPGGAYPGRPPYFPPPHGMGQPPPPHGAGPYGYASHPPPHSYPQYGRWPGHGGPPPPQPHALPPPGRHPPPGAAQPQHAISLQPRRSGASPTPKHGMTSPPTLPPHPMMPSEMTLPEPTLVATAPPSAAAAPPPQRPRSPHTERDRHVQFQNAALIDSLPAPPGPESSARGGADDVPLVISSRRKGHGGRRSGDRRDSADACPSSPATQDLNLSPKSQADLSRATGAASQHTTGTDATGATPLTFLSADISTSGKTSAGGDSLSNYLRGIEDEISGDVGQEVELVAHAPVLEHPRSHRGGSMYSRSTPPRHHRSVGGGSQKSGSSSRHNRRRKRRSGNHIPSNSGQVQVDWSSAGTAGGHGGMGIVCGLGEGAATVGAPTLVGSSTGKSNLACGVILPTPLRSSVGSHPRSPKQPGMGPPLPTTPGGGASHMSPMSPVHSLDLEKMSLCGTENVSQAGGSIGGASLCNVFDDHEDSVTGRSALMDMTMSIGSHPSSGPATDSSAGGTSNGGRARNSPVMGLHPVPLGLNPQAVFGDDRSAGGSALMDMSVGSGANSKAHSKSSGGSSRGSSGRSKSSSGGRGSPASVEKANFKQESQFAEDGREMPPPAPMTMYAHHDFKFTWDGKREE